MPLSRGEGSIRVVSGDDDYPSALPAAPAVVIAIAASVRDRLRIAEAVGDQATVVMVATRAEAMDILNGVAEPAPPLPQPVASELAVSAGPIGVVGLEIDSDWRVACWKGREVSLSPLEHDLLVCLLDEVGHVRAFADLQHRVWGNDHLGDRSHVQSVVKRLRRKLHALDSPLQIDTVRGVGLRLIDARRHHAHDAAVVPRARAGAGAADF